MARHGASGVLNIHGLMALVVFALGYEFIDLPLSLSVFKLIVAPLSMLGVVWMLVRGVPSRALPGLLVLFVFPVLMILAASRWQESRLLTGALGLVPFMAFLYFYVVVYGWGRSRTVATALYSAPHLISLVLYRLGLSGAAYTKTPLRFDGIHGDPNLMVVFILAAASAKFALLDSPQGRWTRRVWILLLLLDYQMVILSGSRGGAVGALALLVAWLVMRLGFRRMLIRVVPPAVLAVGLLLALVPRGGEYSVRPGLSQLFSRFEETSTESGSSSGIRLYLWQRAAEEIRDGGVWIGSSSSRFVEKYEHYPHNTVLDAALETGVPGAVLLVLVVGYSLFVMLAQRRHLQGYQLHIFYLGISFWSTLMFLSSFSAKAFWLSVVLPLGLSVRVSREIASRRARRRGSGGEA